MKKRKSVENYFLGHGLNLAGVAFLVSNINYFSPTFFFLGIIAVVVGSFYMFKNKKTATEVLSGLK
jgi:membrane-bound ClpP family serine protease